MVNHLIRVLVVEDDEDDYILTCDLLSQIQSVKFEVEWVATYERALEAIGRKMHEVYLLDYYLGAHNGLELLREALNRGCTAPLILLTGQDDHAVDFEAMKAGAADYLNKGRIDAPLLERSIRYALERTQTKEALRRAYGELERRVQERTAELQTANELLRAEITERKQVEKALRESQDKYRTLIEQSNDAIYLIFGNKFEIINRKFEELFGVTQEVASAPDFVFTNIVAPRSRAQVMNWIRNEREGQNLAPRYEFTALDKDGREIEVELSVSYFAYRGGVATQGMLRDITERKHLEEQLRQAQKMEAIGRLAGGVAHDFNNLLTVINGYTEILLQSHLDRCEPLRKDIEQIKKAGERASALTRQLLAFSRKQVLRPEMIDLNSVVSEMRDLLNRLLGEDIDLVTTLEPKLGWVKADQGQIEQVIMNLAVNARDAMPWGGKLTIETANVTLDRPYMLPRTEVEPGLYVLLAVSDNGAGMTEEVKAHLFEPFFTTKAEGQGTGLGLATVYGIVKQSGGDIWVYSEAGQGTTIKIYLPQIKVAPEPLVRPEVRAAMPRGTETILLVEDNPEVRHLTWQVLQEQGYTLLEAADGQEALHLFRRYSGRIHLVLTDVVMPGMNGKTLVEQLSQSQPDLKVLFMSGYTDNVIVQHGVLDAEIAFLQKPFSPVRLARKVREVLDQK